MRNVWIVAVCVAMSLSGATALESPVVPASPATMRLPARLQTAAPELAKGEDALLADAEARIDRLRKADATVVVLDRKGRPLPNVQVKVEQIGHSFLFGCAALSLLQHTDAGREATYQQRFGDLFNFATVLTYWQDTDPEPNRKNLDKLTAQVQRLNAMGIRVKGHPLILAGACPRWVPADPDQVRELNRLRIRDLVSRFKGQITVWDVVGDVTTAAGAQNGLGAWARKAGPARLTADALTWARAANPDVLLLYNDYKLDADYTNLIRDLRKARAPLDTLGLEAHMIGSEWPLEKVWQTAETFGQLGRPLHFSEITVLSDDPNADHSKAWPSTSEGEQRQAAYVEKLYTLLFSHPSVSGIAWWNFVDGDWDRIPGGLLRADLSPKPAYERLHHLIQEKWRTQVELMTDATGAVKFRGFTGRYRFTVQTAAGTATMETDVHRDKRNALRLRLK